MTTIYNYKWEAPKQISTPVKVEFELVTILEPISFNEDKTIKEYKEITKYVKKESLWSDFIKSFDLGSISEQVLSHLTKGTPLVTANVLPDGDYTSDSLKRGAEILREMREKGITLDMLEEAIKISSNKKPEEVTSVESEAK